MRHPMLRPSNRKRVFVLACISIATLGCQGSDERPARPRAPGSNSVPSESNVQPQDVATTNPPSAATSSANTTSKPSSPSANETVATSETKAKPAPTFYTVDHYDESRDPAADLVATVQRAQQEKKRILLQVGGDWCGWCKLFTKFIETNATVTDVITDNYVLMKVTYTSKQPNEPFLSQFPKIDGYPHLFVLESDGTLLHSQETGSLEEGKGYNESVVLEFLKKWSPTK